MTRDQILLVIITAFVSTIAKFFLEKLIGPYFPDGKRVWRWMKSFFLFLFQFGVPVAAIIWLMLGPFSVDRLFVFSLVLNFAILLLNLAAELIILVLKRVNRLATSINTQQEVLRDALTVLKGSRENDLPGTDENR